MRLATRKLLDRAFSSMGFMSIALMGIALLVVLVPIFTRGATAFVFKATVEHRRLLFERFDRGDTNQLESEMSSAQAARKPVYDMIHAFEVRQQKTLDTLLPTLEALAARDDSIGRLTRRRLKRISGEEPLLENVDTIKKLLARLEGHVDAASIVQETETIAGGIANIESKTAALVELKESIHELLGPGPDDMPAALPRKQY
jgi:hypothetical protein